MQGHRNGLDHGIQAQCWKPVNPKRPVHTARRTGLLSWARRPGQEQKSFGNSLLHHSHFHKRYWDTRWAKLAVGGARLACYSGGAESWTADVEERHKVGQALRHFQGRRTACEHRCDSRFLQKMPHLGDRDISSGMIT